ncbi:uncharacterized protein LOC130629452 [Hydractinia symbiolongicarpus]|uniref:uncharacterized protein LOC130629452 n=1 Tax=Hydractinia symbiolongicarpus TaxID=13093 RepID=UPI00254C1EE8|nr:uncharacterized protein LOC130629452 [Hydractinia symbiolongicarpus]
MRISAPFFVQLLLKIIHEARGDVQLYLSYTNGKQSYSDTAGLSTSGFADRRACAVLCYKEKILKQWMITSVSFQTGGYCYCSKDKITSFVADTSYQGSHYNFIPVQFEYKDFTVGGFYNAKVNFILHKRGNDKTIFYAFEDLNQPLSASGAINIFHLYEFTDNIKPSTTRQLILHPVTKLNYKLTEWLGEDEEILSPQLSIHFGLSDYVDNQSSNSLWFTMIQENDAMVIVDISKRMNITRPSLSCTLHWKDHTIFFPDLQHFEVYFEIRTIHAACNKNIENLTVVLYHESYLEAYYVSGRPNHVCLEETDITIERNKIVIKSFLFNLNIKISQLVDFITQK